MKQKKKHTAAHAVTKLAYGIDYPVDSLLDTPCMHITGRNDIVVEGCRGILLYTETKIALDLGKFSVTIHGREIEVKNLSKIGLSITGKISTIAYDLREVNN